MKSGKIIGYSLGLVVMLAVFLPGYTKLQELRDKITDLKEKNRRLRKENIVLQRELGRIETDKVLQEKILRDKMGVVRKDEIPVKVVPGNKP